MRTRSAAALLLFAAVQLSAICINAGGPATFQADGTTVDCVADTGFSGGTTYIDAAASGTLRTLRYGTFSYVIPAAAAGFYGFYWLSLTFEDPNVIAPGGRVFYITINGQRSTNIDLAIMNAGTKKPYTLRLPVISYGQVTIAFSTVIRSAIVNEIRLEPAGASNLAPGTLGILLPDGTYLPVVVVGSPAGAVAALVPMHKCVEPLLGTNCTRDTTQPETPTFLYVTSAREDGVHWLPLEVPPPGRSSIP